MKNLSISVSNKHIHRFYVSIMTILVAIILLGSFQNNNNNNKFSSFHFPPSTSNDITNAYAQTVPAYNPHQNELRGTDVVYPQGLGLPRPPPGKGILVAEKITSGRSNVPGIVPADFPLEVRGPNGFSRTFTNVGILLVNPGIYNVYESPPPLKQPLHTFGYYLQALQGDCRNISIAAGETKLCHIRNQGITTELNVRGPPPKQAMLTLNVLVTNDNGGTARTPADFGLRVLNNGRTVTLPAPAAPTPDFPTRLSPYTLNYVFYVPLNAGTYQVTENAAPSGYFPPYFISAPSSGSVRVGDVLVISIINDDRF